MLQMSLSLYAVIHLPKILAHRLVLVGTAELSQQ